MILVAMTNRKDYEQNAHESELLLKELFLSPKCGHVHIQKS